MLICFFFDYVLAFSKIIVIRNFIFFSFSVRKTTLKNEKQRFKNFLKGPVRFFCFFPNCALAFKKTTVQNLSFLVFPVSKSTFKLIQIVIEKTIISFRKKLQYLPVVNLHLEFATAQ